MLIDKQTRVQELTRLVTRIFQLPEVNKVQTDRLANMMINETLVAQMFERDDTYGANFHRYGNREMLEYLSVKLTGNNIDRHIADHKDNQEDFIFELKDEIYNHIAGKLQASAISYDRLIKRLNPAYEERSSIFFEIWKQYETGLNK